MNSLTDFNIEKTTAEILILKKEIQKNIKELNKHGITIGDILREKEEHK